MSPPTTSLPPTTTANKHHTLSTDLTLLLSEFQKLPPSAFIFLLVLFCITVCFLIPPAWIERWLMGGREEGSHGLDEAFWEFGGLNRGGESGGLNGGRVKEFQELCDEDGGDGFAQDGRMGIERSFERVLLDIV